MAQHRNTTVVTGREYNSLELIKWLLAGFVVWLFLAVVSYHSSDNALNLVANYTDTVHNWCGVCGAWCADLLFSFFGGAAYLLPLLLGLLIFGSSTGSNHFSFKLRMLAVPLMMFSISALLDSASGLIQKEMLAMGLGGIVGKCMWWGLSSWFGAVGSRCFLIWLILAEFGVLSGVLYRVWIPIIGQWLWYLICKTGKRVSQFLVKERTAISFDSVKSIGKKTAALAEDLSIKVDKVIRRSIRNPNGANDIDKIKSTNDKISEVPDTTENLGEFAQLESAKKLAGKPDLADAHEEEAPPSSLYMCADDIQFDAKTKVAINTLDARPDYVLAKQTDELTVADLNKLIGDNNNDDYRLLFADKDGEELDFTLLSMQGNETSEAVDICKIDESAAEEVLDIDIGSMSDIEGDDGAHELNLAAQSAAQAKIKKTAGEAAAAMQTASTDLTEPDDVLRENTKLHLTAAKGSVKQAASNRSAVDANNAVVDDGISGGDSGGQHHDWKLPDIDLLERADAKNSAICYSLDKLKELSQMVESKLNDFGIKAKVVNVLPGPVITRFELDLYPGTKASKITGLAKDLARSMSVLSVRIVEVIPGKSVVGLELPNCAREIVRLRELLTSKQFNNSQCRLALALGKDISGEPVVVDLTKMPHLLVAGTTGSGKSVCINALLLSLLYKYTPLQMRLILIDPKMLELSVYGGIPHLLAPVIVDMKEVSGVFHWCVAEMEHRYRLMAALGVRNLAGYNELVQSALSKGETVSNPLWEGEGSLEPKELNTLPYLVVIADEYADMMMVAGKKIEELIVRLAQKARAAGIHLILATQRPSVDVVTGLIKANIPTRIAFQVSSRIDSRTILDQSGAEQLLGAGDMLYLPIGSGSPVRVHGAFVSDSEVHRVVHQLRSSGQTEYMPLWKDGGSNTTVAGEELNNEETDELYDQAVSWVIDNQKVSVSSLQRKFRIGYNRAARLVDSMEENGLVGPMENGGSRRVLVPPPEV